MLCWDLSIFCVRFEAACFLSYKVTHMSWLWNVDNLSAKNINPLINIFCISMLATIKAIATIHIQSNQARVKFCYAKETINNNFCSITEHLLVATLWFVFNSLSPLHLWQYYSVFIFAVYRPIASILICNIDA